MRLRDDLGEPVPISDLPEDERPPQGHKFLCSASGKEEYACTWETGHAGRHVACGLTHAYAAQED